MTPLSFRERIVAAWRLLMGGATEPTVVYAAEGKYLRVSVDWDTRRLDITGKHFVEANHTEQRFIEEYIMFSKPKKT